MIRDAMVNGLMAKALVSSILMFAPRMRRSGLVRRLFTFALNLVQLASKNYLSKENGEILFH